MFRAQDIVLTVVEWTALNAVYELTKLDKEPVGVLPGMYDIRNWVYQFILIPIKKKL